jgi:hypothetical protein
VYWVTVFVLLLVDVERVVSNVVVYVVVVLVDLVVSVVLLVANVVV